MGKRITMIIVALLMVVGMLLSGGCMESCIKDKANDIYQGTNEKSMKDLQDILDRMGNGN